VFESQAIEMNMLDTTKSIVGLTLIIELITIFLRFGLNMKTSNTTALIVGKFTFGIRIHHGYIGILLIIMAVFFPTALVSNRLLITGMSLFLSDVIHHFLVLWPITGSPEFDLLYPKNHR
jgi:hypothetical protein